MAKLNVKRIDKSPDSSRRNFPHYLLQETLKIPETIAHTMGGKTMNRLLLAEALGVKPASSNFRDLLSSSFKYGWTEGTEKADEITLTEMGSEVAEANDANRKADAVKRSAFQPELFRKIYQNYNNKRLPAALLPR